MNHSLGKTGLSLLLASCLQAETTHVNDQFTAGTSAITFSVIGSGTTSYSNDSGAGTLQSDAFKFDAANLNALIGLLPDSLTLGDTIGDYLSVRFRVRQEENFTGYFRFGLFNIGPLSGTGDDNGYYVDFGSGGSRAAWYATGGPANYFGTGTPKDTTYSGTLSTREINLTTPVTLTLKLTRTSTGADFDAINGAVTVYTVSHTTPVTKIDEFAIFTQQARVIWLDDITVTTGSAIPEPATWAAWLGACALITAGTRRRGAKQMGSSRV